MPAGRLIISDMWSEWAPLSSMLLRESVPFLFGVLQNFGGTLFLGMSVTALAATVDDLPDAALDDADAARTPVADSVAAGVAATFASAGELVAGVSESPRRNWRTTTERETNAYV